VLKTNRVSLSSNSALDDRTEAKAEVMRKQNDAKVDKLNQQIAKTSADFKAKLEKTRDELKSKHEKRMEKLKQAGQRVKEAFELRAALAKMQKEYLIKMDDVVVVTKNEKGKAKLHQALNLTAAGAAGGGFWGLLIGMIFMNPLIGAAVGAGAGAISGALSDIGINDKFMKELSETMQPGNSALFVLVREATPDKVLDQLKGFGGKVLKTSLSADEESKLREVLEKA
jgi:uncharacterized membrane protein